MTTSIGISTGSRAAAVQISSTNSSNEQTGNVERSIYAQTITAQFIPPHSSGSFTISEGDSFSVQELAEGINTIDDLRRSAMGSKLATADLDETTDQSWDQSFATQEKGSDDRDPLTDRSPYNDILVADREAGVSEEETKAKFQSMYDEAEVVANEEDA